MLNNIAFGIIISLLFIGLVVLFCILLIKLYFRKIKNYTQLLYQKDIDYQKALTTTIVETQEQVLNNISQDLHDDAGQQLTYINFQLENLKLDSSRWQQTLEPISESLGQLSESIRSISHSLNNQLLLQSDLLKAISAEVSRLQKNKAITIELTINDLDRKVFATNEKIVIYRIFQECLNNIFKHSQARLVKIHIETAPFKMIITDDGKGFDRSKNTAFVSGIGLQNMQQRVALINCDLDIQSALDCGTSITVTQNSPL